MCAMSVLNYSAPYVASAPSGFYPPPLPATPAPQTQDEGPYSYPAPSNPFLGEEYPPSSKPTYTRVQGGGSKTRLHAVIDYDDDYYDDAGAGGSPPSVTPIQGPILLKNGTVPVVPLYSYPVLNNGTFVQIPVSTPFFLFYYKRRLAWSDFYDLINAWNFF